MDSYRFIYIPLFCLLVLCSAACTGHKGGKDTLMVSLPAQKWLLDSIVGDRFEVEAILDAGSNPETFEPTMQQLMSLQNSVAYFTVGGLGFELASLPKIQENFPDLQVIGSSDGIVPIEHTHAHAEGHGKTHSHDDADPHVWTSLPNARVLARNMYDAVIRIDPDGKDYYAARFKALDSSLAALNDSISELLLPLKGRSFIVWHPSLSYFARDYGLNQISIEVAGKEASPARYKEQLDMSGDTSPLLFFTQAEFDSRQAANLAAELGLATSPIAVMQADIPAQIRQIANDLHRAANSRN